MQIANILESKKWPIPESRGVGLFSDLTLYADALALASEFGVVYVALLKQEIGPRLRKMLLVRQQSQRAMEDVVRELKAFGWIQPRNDNGNPTSEPHYIITLEGQSALTLSKSNKDEFRRLLTVKMHTLYIIPGWFVARLWQINSGGQGEVILPSPLQNWSPSSRKWDDNNWDNDLHTQTLAAARAARKASPNSFPIRDEDWLKSVKCEWQHQSNLIPRVHLPVARVSYSPRKRLTIAMREACMKLLFNQKPYQETEEDFSQPRPLNSRSFIAWCPRLEFLELLFYTDWHPLVNGRLLFPTSVFRQSAPIHRFNEVSQIHDPKGYSLWLHQPPWETARNSYLNTLRDVHREHSLRVGAIYVSFPDVRDEVCRRLRISSLYFDRYFEKALDELPSDDYPWTIAIESDMREDLSSGAGLLRRPIYLEGIPHTLIGLGQLAQSYVR